MKTTHVIDTVLPNLIHVEYFSSQADSQTNLQHLKISQETLESLLNISCRSQLRYIVFSKHPIAQENRECSGSLDLES